MTRDLTRDAFVAVLRRHTYVRADGGWNSDGGTCRCDAWRYLTEQEYAEHVADALFPEPLSPPPGDSGSATTVA